MLLYRLYEWLKNITIQLDPCINCQYDPRPTRAISNNLSLYFMCDILYDPCLLIKK